jgi:hypothetical protein
MSAHRLFIAINFPQREYTWILMAAANVESNDAGLFDRSIAQLAKDRLRSIGILRGEPEPD